jgi:hypothetical protein
MRLYTSPKPRQYANFTLADRNPRSADDTVDRSRDPRTKAQSKVCDTRAHTLMVERRLRPEMSLDR